MNAPIFISPRVINTINSLPQEDRIAVTSALSAEFILGTDTQNGSLNAVQALAYTIIRSYVQHDTKRYSTL